MILILPFNKPAITGNELLYIQKAIQLNKLSGDGEFTRKCRVWFEEKLKCRKALLTTSCTHALEMAAILADIQAGDEIIMPSYTFVSTANAFVLRGAKIVFVDIRPDTMNINEHLIVHAITARTKAIVPVHYAGVSCDMGFIMDIAERYNLIVIEDAAQAVMSTYKGKPLGTIGHFGCYSFHETKNYNCGEGGALIINDDRFLERAEFIREKGTNRSQYFRGQVDKYTWVDLGSSYLPSEINAAFLFAQLEQADKINADRLHSWLAYDEGLKSLDEKGHIETPVIPDDCEHNAHMYYIKVKDLEIRTKLIEYLIERDVCAVFHYVPLHTSIAGTRFSEFIGEDHFTTIESERLIRLPMFYGLERTSIKKTIELISDFFASI